MTGVDLKRSCDNDFIKSKIAKYLEYVWVFLLYENGMVLMKHNLSLQHIDMNKRESMTSRKLKHWHCDMMERSLSRILCGVLSLSCQRGLTFS